MKRVLLVATLIAEFSVACAVPSGAPSPKKSAQQHGTMTGSSASGAPVKLIYSRKIPAAVRAGLSRSCNSWFYGTAEVPSLHSGLLLVHFYGVPYRVVVDGTPTYKYKKMLDIFSQTGKNHKKVRRLGSVRIDQQMTFFDSFGIEVRWLVPATKNTLVLKLKTQIKDGFYGPFGREYLFVFDKGLSKQPQITEFFYQTNHNDNDSVSFDSVDEKGMLVVTTQHMINTGGVDIPGNPHIEEWHWNGKQFVVRKILSPNTTTGTDGAPPEDAAMNPQ